MKGWPTIISGVKKVSLTALLLLGGGAALLAYLIHGQLSMSSIEEQMHKAYAREQALAKAQAVQEPTRAAPLLAGQLWDQLWQASVTWSDVKSGGSSYGNNHTPGSPYPAANSVHGADELPRVASTWQGMPERPEVFARMRIPKIDLIAPIVHGVGEADIKTAIGYFTGETALPGEVGNSAYAAHNSSVYGAFFNRLDEVELNDEIIIDTKEYSYTYTVTDRFVVRPEDVWVLQPFEPGSRTLTLVTCEEPDRGGNQYRVIVRGVMS